MPVRPRPPAPPRFPKKTLERFLSLAALGRLGVAAGDSLHVVGRCSAIAAQATDRYAHFADHPVKAAADRGRPA